MLRNEIFIILQQTAFIKCIEISVFAPYLLIMCLSNPIFICIVYDQTNTMMIERFLKSLMIIFERDFSKR